MQLQDNQLILSIKDDGAGVSKKDIGKIFDAYYSTAKESGGTGLGLNIVKQLVEQRLHSTIAVISQPDKGCEFIISRHLA